MSGPTDEPWTRAMAAIIFLFVLGAFLADGCHTCATVCADRGEVWHWNEGDGLPPIVDGCTCVGSDNVLRWVPVSPQPETPGV